MRVANDFKTEAQQELQKIILENKTYRERVRLLEGQLDKLKGKTRKQSIFNFNARLCVIDNFISSQLCVIYDSFV